MAATLAALVDGIVSSHIDTKLDQIIANQALILNGQAALKSEQDAIRADLAAIKVFMGVSDAVATQDQVDALGAKIQQETAAIDQFDASVQEPPQP